MCPWLEFMLSFDIRIFFFWVCHLVTREKIQSLYYIVIKQSKKLKEIK